MMKHSPLRLRLAWLLLIPILGPVSCNRGPELAAAQSADEVASLEKTKTRLENELKALRTEFETRQNDILRKNDELMKSNDELKAQFEKAQDDAARIRREFDEYVAKYKTSLRAKAKGMQLPRLETAEKTVFESVVVREVTPTELSFSHAGGVTRIELAKLPGDMQRKFFYDPDEVKAMEAAAAAAAAAAAEVAKSLPEVQALPVAEPGRAINPIAVKNLTDRILARQAEIAKAEKEAVEVKRSSYGGTNIAQYRVSQLGARAARLKSEIAELRALLAKELNGQRSAGGPR
jgi:hypothetical protein